MMLSKVGRLCLSHTSSADSITNDIPATSKVPNNILQVSIGNNRISTVSLYMPVAQIGKADTLIPIECSAISLKAAFVNSGHDPNDAGFKQKDILQGLLSTDPGLIPKLEMGCFFKRFPVNDLAEDTPAGKYCLARIKFVVSRPETLLSMRVSRFLRPNIQSSDASKKQDNESLLLSKKKKETQRYLLGIYHTASKKFFVLPEDQLKSRSTKIAKVIDEFNDNLSLIFEELSLQNRYGEKYIVEKNKSVVDEYLKISATRVNDKPMLKKKSYEEILLRQQELRIKEKMIHLEEQQVNVHTDKNLRETTED